MRRKIGLVASASAAALIVGELISLVQVIALARLLSPAEVGLFTAGTVLTASLCDFVEGGLRSALVQRGGRIDDAAETVFRATLVSGALLTLGVLAAAPLVALVFDQQHSGTGGGGDRGKSDAVRIDERPRGDAAAGVQCPPAHNRRAGGVPYFRGRGRHTRCLRLGRVEHGAPGCTRRLWFGSLCVWLISDWRPGRGQFSFTLWRELAKFGFPLVVAYLASVSRSWPRPSSLVVVWARPCSVSTGMRSASRRSRSGESSMSVPSRCFPRSRAFPAIRTRLRAAYLRALRWSMIGAAPLTALMIALGEPAVVVVLGEPWREAGVAVVAMAGIGVGRALCIVGEEAIKGAGRTSLLNWCTATEVGAGADPGVDSDWASWVCSASGWHCR